MSIASLNINSLQCHCEEIRLLLKEYGVHVMALNENKMDSKNPKDLSMISGYEHEQREKV